MIELGQKVRDMITGYTGIAFGRGKYLAGCDRIMVQSQFKKGDKEYPESIWIDEPQLEVIGTKTISLDKEDKPIKKTGGPPSKHF